MNQEIEKLLKKTELKQGIYPLQVFVYSESKNINIEYPKGCKDKLFHIASVGKLISTTYVLKLMEEGLLKLDDPISKYLDIDLNGLFFSNPNEITIKDCLTHRSGAKDYFEGKDKQGNKFTDLVINNPEQSWDRESILKFCKDNLKPKDKKGEKFSYGDTAFMLVLMCVEKIKQKDFNILLDEEIFKPLNMKNTQSMIYQYPSEERLYPEHIYFGKFDIKHYKSLNCDQADGGIVSTPNDLVLFQKALYSSKIISNDSIELMKNWQGVFRPGIHYGMGMMQIRFEGFFFLMRNFPRLIGHIGILSTHSFYDEENDIHYILNFGTSDNMTQSFVFLSNLVGLFKKHRLFDSIKL